ncbi:MAG: LamG domain-containing protein [Paludibacter sp.]
MKMKNYFFNLMDMGKICMLSASLVISSTVFATDIITGLKLHYTFETVAGTNVPDDSGTGNVGVINGAAVTAPGEAGQGMLFSSAKADFIKIPADINIGLTSFTYATWVNLPALKNATRFFDLGNGINAVNSFLAFIPSYNGDNGFVCLRYRPATGTAYNALSTVKIPIGVWAHVALTYSWSDVTSTATATIYINGAASGTTTGIPFNPSQLGTTADNYVGYSRWAQDLNGFGGTMDDVRLYNRALTSDEILILKGTPPELITAFNGLAIAGDLTNVTANLTLPTTLANGVTVSWASTLPLVVTPEGKINRPDLYDATVKLTATLSETVNGVTSTLTKVFSVVVKSFTITAEQIAEWNFAGDQIAESNGGFTVKDVKTGFVGTLKNEARIRTIGTTEQYNVLDLGNGTGYFDMGTEIGKAIYSLNNYTMCGYFRVDADYPSIASNGNFYWTFSNTDSVMTRQTGYIIGSLKNQSQSISTNYYGLGNQAVGAGSAPTLGAWHHFAYTQFGTIGTVYVDGLNVATGSITNLPATALTIDGRMGTMFNWLGRSNYVGDVYLRKTLLYDFQLLSIPLTADDLNFGFEVPATLDKLNVAYTENPDYILPELTTEQTNLTLGDLSAVTANITLPTKASNTTVNISWKSTNDKLIDATGIVTRPDYYNYPDTLIATLSKNGQKVTKSFPAVVLMKEGTAFVNNLLMKYDFSSVTDSTVTDVAEKHFKGTLKQKASVKTIGSTVKYNVLNLGDSIGYFDMGTEIGKMVYHLDDYTMSAYYRVDTAYLATELAKAGNFLWNFSNTTNIMTNAKGYIIASSKNSFLV